MQKASRCTQLLDQRTHSNATTFTSAPCPTSNCTTCKSPCRAALCRGVKPSLRSVQKEMGEERLRCRKFENTMQQVRSVLRARHTCHHHAALHVFFVYVCPCSEQQPHHIQTALPSSSMQGSDVSSKTGTAEERGDAFAAQNVCVHNVKMQQDTAASQQCITRSHPPTSQLEPANSHACT